MVEFNFLTIIVSLAVCSLLVYAVFQYTKVRLSVLEQSHKEQAMILQQYIEESSTDIHRLYQMTTSGRSESIPQNGGGSIILEYANDTETHAAAATYNEPHTIHLDTAFFQNKRSSNLIEISSDSEDTSDSESEATSDSESEDTSDSESDDNDDNDDNEQNVQIEQEHVIVPENVEYNETVNHSPSTETKMVTVDLGAIQEPDIKSCSEKPFDVLTLLYQKAQQTPLPDDAADEVDAVEIPHLSAATQEQNVPAVVTLTGMSVTELKSLLKEKYKNHPEKHAEIQKYKKAELINALQQTQ